MFGFPFGMGTGRDSDANDDVTKDVPARAMLRVMNWRRFMGESESANELPEKVFEPLAPVRIEPGSRWIAPPRSGFEFLRQRIGRPMQMV